MFRDNLKCKFIAEVESYFLPYNNKNTQNR